MNNHRLPMIRIGQLYLHEDLNEYIVITRTERGQVRYAGNGVNGHAEAITFLEKFQPVDPMDVEPQEIHDLLELCPIGTRASTGYIKED